MLLPRLPYVTRSKSKFCNICKLAAPGPISLLVSNAEFHNRLRSKITMKTDFESAGCSLNVKVITNIAFRAAVGDHEAMASWILNMASQGRRSARTFPERFAYSMINAASDPRITLFWSREIPCL